MLFSIVHTIFEFSLLQEYILIHYLNKFIVSNCILCFVIQLRNDNKYFNQSSFLISYLSMLNTEPVFKHSRPQYIQSKFAFTFYGILYTSSVWQTNLLSSPTETMRCVLSQGTTESWVTLLRAYDQKSTRLFSVHSVSTLYVHAKNCLSSVRPIHKIPSDDTCTLQNTAWYLSY